MMQSSPSSSTKEKLRILIQNLGGAQNFENLVLKFYQKMSQDLMIGFFFQGRDLSVISKKQSSFILAAAGIIGKYDGRGPATAHVDLPPILLGHFDRRIVLLKELLKEEKIEETTAILWIQFEESFRQMVVSHS